MSVLTKEILDQMETGDLLLFHGEDYWFSRLIEWVTWSEFSHVGMILRDPTYIDPKLTGLYMLESGTENFPDAVTHRICFGVQIVDFQKLIDSYVGKVYYRKLNAEPTIKAEFPTVLTNIWDKVKGLPYDDSAWDFFRAEFGIDWGDMTRTDEFFCSALLSFTYDKFNLFSKIIPWDSVTPEEFNQGKQIDKILIESVNLGDLQRLK